MAKEFDGIAHNDLVTITKMNHIIELQYMEKRNSSCPIQKIDRDRYVIKETGEIMEFEHIVNRLGSVNSLRQTFKKMRYLINNNFLGKPNELHVTLTYAENMTDTKRLYDDMRKFMMRLKYKYKDISAIDYLNVVEPQGRGAWHCHLLLRFNDVPNVYIDNATLKDCWGHGFVKIKSLKDIDNIGAYLSAYLTDIELTLDGLDPEEAKKIFVGHELEVVTKTVEGQEKKFVKGGRLYMYPPGMNLFRKSKGIQYPERINMRYEKAKKIVGSAKPHYEKTYHIENDEGFQNTIHFEQYNLKR